MLYAHLPDTLTTIVAAAPLRSMLDEWHATLQGLYYTDVRASDMMDSLTDPVIGKFRAPVYIFTHATAFDQEAFVSQHQITTGTVARVADKHGEMMDMDEPDPYDVKDKRTIEELAGLGEDDRFDKRSEEQKAKDLEIKKVMDKMREAGELSEESFSPRKVEAGDDKMNVRKVTVLQDRQGATVGARVMAVKETNVDIKVNADLTIEVGGKKVVVDVQWKGSTLYGSDSVVQDIWVDQIYGDPSVYKATVRTHDKTQNSIVIFNPAITNIHSIMDFEEPEGSQQEPAEGHYVDPMGQEYDEDGEAVLSADPKDYLFAFYKTPGDNEPNVFGDATVFVVVPRAFFEKNGGLLSTHMCDFNGGQLKFPSGYEEEMEATIAVEDKTQDEVRAELLAMGLVESKEVGELINK